MGKRLLSVLLTLLLLLSGLPIPAMAAVTTTVTLSVSTAAAGETVTVSGASGADTWIAVKVLDSASNIVVLDFVKSVANGSYNCTFIVPPVADGILRVIAGYGANVARAELTVGEHHAVTVSPNPAEAGTVTGGGAYNKGAAVTVTATPHSGYTFVNWTENGAPVSTDAAYTFTLGASGRSLAANFTQTPPDITKGIIAGMVTDGTSPVSGATVSLTVGGSVYSAATIANGSFSILNVPPGTGYTVTAAKSGYTGGSAANVSVTANTTTSGVNIVLTAILPASHTVNVSANPAAGGTVAGGGTYNEGAPVTVTASVYSGYNFIDWTENNARVSSDALYSFIMGTADRNLTANFATVTTAVYSVGVSASPVAGGSVTGGGTYAEGASVTVTAAAYSGYTFVNWTENGAPVSTGASYVFTLGASGRSFVANFAAIPPATYTVTFDSQGGSSVASISGIASGSTISAPAAPTRSGYTFGGWYREPSCVNAWNFSTDTVTKNTTLYAKWTYISGGGGGSSAPTPTPEPKPTARVLDSKGNISVSVNLKLDNSTGIAAVEVDSASLTGAFEKSATNDKGIKTVVIDIPEIDGAKAYEPTLPASFLTAGDASRVVEIKTGVASVTVPGNMIAAADAAGAQNVSLTIAAGDRSKLDAAVQAQIGDRPVIELNLKVDGKQTAWNNDSAPVTVTVPYAPTAEELKDPEHITVWYIDGSGKAVAVPNGRYDPATGKVTFTATHFSRYVVAYVHKTFGDLGGAAWARKPIEVMASKGIISGTGKDVFSPAANITRADYLVLLVKTLGLTAEFDSNFDDAEPGAYYYEAAGIAKKLGIASGGGNNRFNPKENISRQDMMVLTARALEKFKGIKAADTSSVLDKFSDKGDIAGYAVNSLTTLVKEGLITGSGDSLNPRANTTRAEAAVFLYSVYNKY